MGIPSDGELKGKAEQAKGRVKEAAGVLSDNERLESEGRAERAGGEVREGVHKAKRKVGEAIQDIGGAIKR